MMMGEKRWLIVPSAVCLQNLSSLDLKMLTESAAIISCGRFIVPMVYYSLAEEVPFYFYSASDFVNSSILFPSVGARQAAMLS